MRVDFGKFAKNIKSHNSIQVSLCILDSTLNLCSFFSSNRNPSTSTPRGWLPQEVWSFLVTCLGDSWRANQSRSVDVVRDSTLWNPGITRSILGILMWLETKNVRLWTHGGKQRLEVFVRLKKPMRKLDSNINMIGHLITGLPGCTPMKPGSAVRKIYLS